MKRLLVLFLVVASLTSVYSQTTNVALLFHTNNHSDFEFLDKQVSMIKGDLLDIYGFRTSPYKNFSKLNLINTISNECKVDTTQLLVYIAGITLKNDEGTPFIMLAESDSTEYEDMLSYEEISQAIAGCEVRNLLIIMDVAGSAEAMKGAGDKIFPLVAPFEPDSTLSNEDFIAGKMKFQSRSYIASGSDNLEPSGRYTAFSSKLMEALRNYGGNDGILTLHELKSYMENLADLPFLGALDGNQTGGEFLFIAR